VESQLQPPIQMSIDRDEVILSDVPVQPTLPTSIDPDEPILSDVPNRSAEHENERGEVLVTGNLIEEGSDRAQAVYKTIRLGISFLYTSQLI
jgi:hypothetical protein